MTNTKYYTQSSYSHYSDYKTKDKKYECRTGPFEGFFVSSVEFCDVKDKKDDRAEMVKEVHQVHKVHKVQ